MEMIFALENIPQEFASTEEKLKFVKTEIKETAKVFNKNGKVSVESAVRLGSLLNVQKGLVNGQEKGSWEKYRETKLTSVNKRTAQRCMALARSLGPVLQKSAKLSWAGQTRLLLLAKLAKRLGNEVAELLDDHEVSLDFDHKKVKQVKAFHDQIDQLLDEVKPQKEKKKKGLKATILRMKKSATTWAAELEASSSDSELLDGVKPETIHKAIKKVGKLLKQLQRAETRITAEDSDREAA
jgi:hypothetical protein